MLLLLLLPDLILKFVAIVLYIYPIDFLVCIQSSALVNTEATGAILVHPLHGQYRVLRSVLHFV